MDTIKRPNAALVEFWDAILSEDPRFMDPDDSEDARDRAESWDVCAVAALAPWASAICHHTSALLATARAGQDTSTAESRLAIETRPEAVQVVEYFQLGCDFETALADFDLAVAEADEDTAREEQKRARVIFEKIRTLAKAEYTD